MFVINVFGLGIIYRVLEISNTMVSRLETVAKTANVSFSEVFFDFDLIEKCGVGSFKDLPVQQKGIGSLVHTDTILEIRHQRRKINQFPLSDLRSQEYLFPLYNVKDKSFEVLKKEGFQYFFLYQVIKGRIVKYLMKNFQGIDYLEFENTQFNFENQRFVMLTSVKYSGDLLVAESDDSVVIEQHVIKI
jgi:hypothetical protein